MSAVYDTSTRIPVKMGRPSKYHPDLVVEVCARLAQGEPLTVICNSPHMPCDDTVRSWANSNPELATAIARAREVGFDTIVERARKTLRGIDEAGGGESTGDVIRDKAIADFDLKLLAKRDPKRYGEARQIELVGAGGGPIQVETRSVVDPMSLPPELRDAWRDILELARASAARDVTPRGEGE